MDRGLIVVEDADGPGPGWAPQDRALTEVANRPLLVHAVTFMRELGVGDVVIAAAAGRVPALQAALNGSSVRQDGVRWVALSGPSPVRIEDGIRAVAALPGRGRLLLQSCDGIHVGEPRRLRQALADPEVDGLLGVRPAAGDTPVALHGRRSVRRLAVTGGQGDGPELHGAHVLGERLLAAMVADGGDVGLLEVADRMLDDRRAVQVTVHDGWQPVGSCAAGLLAANRSLLDGMVGVPFDPKGGNRVEGRVQVHPSANVVRSFLCGPLLVGPDVELVDAYIGPYTAIGAGGRVENAEVEGSIVLKRAQVRNVPVRIFGSVIGAGATVERDFTLPRAVRMVLPAQGRVTLT